MLILGSSPAPDTVEKVKHIKGREIMSINGAYRYYKDIKIDHLIWQDAPYYKAPNLITKEIMFCKQDGGEWFYNVQKPDLDKDSKNLCFYPYTGVAGIDYCFKKGYNDVILAGFTFGRYHNYPNKKQMRDRGTLSLYIRNVKELMKVIKIYSLQKNEIGIEVI